MTETETSLQTLMTARAKCSGGPNHVDQFELHSASIPTQSDPGGTYGVTHGYLYPHDNTKISVQVGAQASFT